MRPARIRGAFTYHCMTRITGGEYLLGDAEKEVLRNLMWRVRDFCGVQIFTYCLMSNHFHVLVDVPEA
ncbi:MAG: transposase, partial [Opitutales bacterium]